MEIQLTNEDRAILLIDKISTYLLESVKDIGSISVFVSDKNKRPEFLESRLSIFPLLIVGGINNRDLSIDFRSMSEVKMSEETFTLNVGGTTIYKTVRELKKDLLEMFPEIKDEGLYEKNLYFNENTIKEAVKSPNSKIAAKELDSDLDNKKVSHRSVKI